MKIHGCGWRIRHGIGRRSFGCWRKRMSKDENMAGTHDYMTHVSDAASFEAYNRHDESPNLSAETLPESSSMIDFRAFAAEYPDKLFPLLLKLRPEFIELFAEYWLLGKSQAFIGRVHGHIQTRTWQALRIIERALGSLIVLGTDPGAEIIRPILRKACVESTAYGSLTDMIVLYASTQNYALVAEKVGAPVPAIRKIFRPAIAKLSASKDLRTAAVGSYLHNLTHQASLTGAGLSKRCLARTRRVKNLRFNAPPSENSPLISFGHVESLGDTPWNMLEISSDHRMAQIGPTLRSQGKRLFGKKPAQIFAPLNADGELVFGYIFARSATPAMTRKLTHIRGIGEMSAICDGDGNFVRAVDVPHADVLKMMEKHRPATTAKIHAGDFVEVLTGEAKNYCGTARLVGLDGRTEVQVEVNFPTGRQFLVFADQTSVKKLPKTPIKQRAFWGVLDS